MDSYILDSPWIPISCKTVSYNKLRLVSGYVIFSGRFWSPDGSLYKLTVREFTQILVRETLLMKKSLSWFVQVGRKDDDSDDEFLAISHNSISSHSRKYRNPGKIAWFWSYALNMWPTNVKNHLTLGRPLASFIFCDQTVLIPTWN